MDISDSPFKFRTLQGFIHMRLTFLSTQVCMYFLFWHWRWIFHLGRLIGTGSTLSWLPYLQRNSLCLLEVKNSMFFFFSKRWKLHNPMHDVNWIFLLYPTSCFLRLFPYLQKFLMGKKRNYCRFIFKISVKVFDLSHKKWQLAYMHM